MVGSKRGVTIDNRHIDRRRVEYSYRECLMVPRKRSAYNEKSTRHEPT
jgi:hypothetical protein